MKDLGHAVINQLDANNIINAATTQGIYDLTLGLSDKETDDDCRKGPQCVCDSLW